MNKDNGNSLEEAFEATVNALPTVPSDAALIASGRMLAKNIDEATTHGTLGEATKALYLMPHLVKVIGELHGMVESRERKEAEREEAEIARKKRKEQEEFSRIIREL